MSRLSYYEGTFRPDCDDSKNFKMVFKRTEVVAGKVRWYLWARKRNPKNWVLLKVDPVTLSNLECLRTLSFHKANRLIGNHQVTQDDLHPDNLFVNEVTQ